MILSWVPRIRKLKWLLYFLLAFTTISAIIYTVYNGWDQDKYDYFKNTPRLQRYGLLVDNPNCKIRDIHPFDIEVEQLFETPSPDEDCLTHKNWSYLVGNTLILETATMHEELMKEGIPVDNVTCCIYVITRDTSPTRVESFKADNYVQYSNCIQITQRKTELKFELNKIVCTDKQDESVVYYISYHAVALRIGKERKLNHWRNRREAGLGLRPPPSVIIIGQDSTSRLNFRRHMLKTRKMLEELGALEMKGFVKVGLNTYPNIVPMLTGRSEDNMNKICHQNRTDYFDPCPFIFKNFSQSNYITAWIEDAPRLAIFNFAKSGYNQQPTDFYSRPFWRAAFTTAFGSVFRRPFCLGRLTTDEAICNWIERIVKLALNESTPVFSLSWATAIAHDDISLIQTADETYFNLLHNLNRTGGLGNSIIFFMGDHGFRFGKLRSTAVGFYEAKLPNMWIYLPNRIKEEHPEWAKALEINKYRLSTPYTVYETLSLILKEYSGVNMEPGEFTGDFFHELDPMASCKSSGIPGEYCPCYEFVPVSLTDHNLIRAIEGSLNHLNNEVINGTDCMKLTLKSVKSGANATLFQENLVRYITCFSTYPGDFNFEIMVDYDGKNDVKGSWIINRSDQITQSQTTCIRNNTDFAKLELYCYC